MMTICAVAKDDVKHHVLCDERGIFPFSRKQTQAIVEALQAGLLHITDDDIVELNKRALLDHQPDWFLEEYGRSDPLWIEYVATHPERNLPPAKQSRKPTPGFVYVIKGDQRYKIGRTKNPKQRLKPMGAHAPFPLHVLMVIPSDDMEATEDALHERFAAQRIRGEWFDLSDHDLAAIRQNYTIMHPITLRAD